MVYDLHLVDKYNALASTLSGGMQRRLCIGIAFIAANTRAEREELDSKAMSCCSSQNEIRPLNATIDSSKSCSLSGLHMIVENRLQLVKLVHLVGSSVVDNVKIPLDLFKSISGHEISCS
ncbi:hypothetical protein NECAME_06501 [Necator americanus]|uniref:ABC transporter domain-containing protein n=1 Tax=Necator americanus TaxID=51031 RepID=W2TVX0_NECAM|nr:hypothetical protein NECAME_06501 [Necator americanus]ETN85206.1 hypothetical protein NECAME_06501 [Necator americanus]